MARTEVGGVPLVAVATQAVTQLYLEEALPRARLMQWCVERLCACRVPLSDLREACRGVPGILVEDLEPRRSRFIVRLRRPPHGFTTFSDGLDEPIPRVLMCDVQQTLGMGSWPITDHADHQGFAIAAWLRSAGPPRLRLLSLGRALAIVRSSLLKYSLLGKRGGRIVPYRDSDQHERRANMRSLVPTGVAAGEYYVASWPALHHALVVLLQDHDGALPIARLKPLFRALFKAELSETAFGYSTVAELVSGVELGRSFCVEDGPAGASLLRFCGDLARVPSSLHLQEGGFKVWRPELYVEAEEQMPAEGQMPAGGGHLLDDRGATTGSSTIWALPHSPKHSSSNKLSEQQSSAVFLPPPLAKSSKIFTVWEDGVEGGMEQGNEPLYSTWAKPSLQPPSLQRQPLGPRQLRLSEVLQPPSLNHEPSWASTFPSPKLAAPVLQRAAPEEADKIKIKIVESFGYADDEVDIASEARRLQEAAAQPETPRGAPTACASPELSAPCKAHRREVGGVGADSPPPRSDTQRLTPQPPGSELLSAEVATGASLSTCTSLGSASLSPLPPWCSIRRTFIEAQHEEEEEEECDAVARRLLARSRSLPPFAP